MNKEDLPRNLQAIIGDQEIDFVGYAKRKYPRALSFGLVGLGVFWLSLTSIAAYAFFKPLLNGGELHIRENGVEVTATMDNLDPVLVPALLLIVFLVAGFFILVFGITIAFKKGGYFVGTKDRIINYAGQTINYYDWEQFTGNIELNFKKKNISLEMRRGRFDSKDKGRHNEFVPDTLHVSGIENLVELEKVCRIRIKENDPTPATTL